MSDISIGESPPVGLIGGIGNYTELAAVAIANPGEWVSAPAVGTTANVHTKVKTSVAVALADVRVSGGRVYLRFNGIPGDER